MLCKATTCAVIFARSWAQVLRTERLSAPDAADRSHGRRASIRTFPGLSTRAARGVEPWDVEGVDVGRKRTGRGTWADRDVADVRDMASHG